MRVNSARRLSQSNTDHIDLMRNQDSMEKWSLIEPHSVPKTVFNKTANSLTKGPGCEGPNAYPNMHGLGRFHEATAKHCQPSDKRGGGAHGPPRSFGESSQGTPAPRHLKETPADGTAPRNANTDTKPNTNQAPRNNVLALRRRETDKEICHPSAH